MPARRSRDPSRGMISADVAPRRALDPRAVATAEQHGVHEQREELPEAEPVAVAGCERARLLVGGEDALAGTAEQAEHRQVDLAVTAIGRRVDQPGAAVGA